MIQRSSYTDLIKLYMNKPFIKVITGIHRCGKSTALMWIRQELQKRGVPYQDILYINFEALRHGKIRDGETLLRAVRQQRTEQGENQGQGQKPDQEQHPDQNAEQGRKRYLLLDEIQYLPGWERVVKTLYERENCDLYLTGSRAGILESPEAALIARNCVQIRMYPYSFSEYLEQFGEEESGADRESCFRNFFIYGSMPGIHGLKKEEEGIWQYLLDVCRAGILQDAVRESNLRNVGQLWMLLEYLADHLGEPLSAKTISDGMNRNGRQISKDTVYAMLKALESGHLIYRARRYDLKAERVVEAREKYYFTDWGMCHAIKGVCREKVCGVLENMVCMELLARGFRVYRGKIGRKEFDFLAERGREHICIQVRERVSGETLEEAAGPFVRLKGGYQKLILSMDEEDGRTGKNEIRHRNLLAFLENI
ncbi:MAG: ATP-binding protein [Candidatus Limivivens sp.]|nr:ATP-binding protein [Candidatus Limivivens sp.]